MESKDAQYINNMLKDFGVNYFTNAESNDSGRISVSSTRRGAKETQNFTFNEVPPFILALMNEHTKMLLEQQKALFDTYKDEVNVLLIKKDETIADLRSELREVRNDFDALANHSRRDNLKIEGIEFTDGEDTNQIIKDIAKYGKVELEEAEISASISTSHRLGSTKPDNAIPGQATTKKKIPSLFVRFNQRDVKTKFFDARKNLANNPECPAKYKAIAIYEDVTPLRSRIMYELRQRGDKQAFKYVWCARWSYFLQDSRGSHDDNCSQATCN